MAPPSGGTDPVGTNARHTLVYINLRGGADGLTMLAPASDSFYQQSRTPGPLNNGTLIAAAAPNVQLGTTGWWLPQALSPLQLIYDRNHLAAIPAVGMTNYNQSHFVAMDRMELGVPAGGAPVPSSGFMARALDSAQFSSEAPLRGLVMSPRGTTSFLEAPKSLAIPDVTNFDFPSTAPAPPDQGMIEAMQDMHDLAADPVLKDASATAFGAIDYLKSAYTTPASVQPIGPGVDEYPSNGFGVQLRRAAQLILAGNPPEVIEIDIGGWDHHSEQEPNLPNGRMYVLLDTLARGLRAFYRDMATNDYSQATSGKWIDHVTCMTISEFGRQIQENGNLGTDHGKGGVMFVMGGAQLNGGVKDTHWNGGLAGMNDNGDVAIGLEYRDVFGEAFAQLFNVSMSDLTTSVFPGHNYMPIGLFN